MAQMGVILGAAGNPERRQPQLPQTAS